MLQTFPCTECNLFFFTPRHNKTNCLWRKCTNKKRKTSLRDKMWYVPLFDTGHRGIYGESPSQELMIFYRGVGFVPFFLCHFASFYFTILWFVVVLFLGENKPPVNGRRIIQYINCFHVRDLYLAASSTGPCEGRTGI